MLESGQSAGQNHFLSSALAPCLLPFIVGRMNYDLSWDGILEGKQMQMGLLHSSLSYAHLFTRHKGPTDSEGAGERARLTQTEKREEKPLGRDSFSPSEWQSPKANSPNREVNEVELKWSDQEWIQGRQPSHAAKNLIRRTKNTSGGGQIYFPTTMSRGPPLIPVSNQEKSDPNSVWPFDSSPMRILPKTNSNCQKENIFFSLFRIERREEGTLHFSHCQIVNLDLDKLSWRTWMDLIVLLRSGFLCWNLSTRWSAPPEMDSIWSPSSEFGLNNGFGHICIRKEIH